MIPIYLFGLLLDSLYGPWSLRKANYTKTSHSLGTNSRYDIIDHVKQAISQVFNDGFQYLHVVPIITYVWSVLKNHIQAMSVARASSQYKDDTLPVQVFPL